MHIGEGLSQPGRKLSCATTVGCRTAIATIARVLRPSCRRNCILQIILAVREICHHRRTRVAWMVERHAKIWSERGVSTVRRGSKVGGGYLQRGRRFSKELLSWNRFVIAYAVLFRRLLIALFHNSLLRVMSMIETLS